MATQIAYDRGAASLDCHERGHEGSIVVQKVREMVSEEGFNARRTSCKRA